MAIGSAHYVSMTSSTADAMHPYAALPSKGAAATLEQVHNSYAQGMQSSGGAMSIRDSVVRSASSSSRDTASKGHQCCIKAASLQWRYIIESRVQHQGSITAASNSAKCIRAAD